MSMVPYSEYQNESLAQRAARIFRIDYVALALLAFTSVMVWTVLLLQVTGVIDTWFD